MVENLKLGFKVLHRTETALIKVKQKLLTASDNRLVSVFILLDLIAPLV